MASAVNGRGLSSRCNFEFKSQVSVVGTETQKRTVPSFLVTKTTREAQDELDFRMMPFFSMVETSLSTNFSPSIPVASAVFSIFIL